MQSICLNLKKDFLWVTPRCPSYWLVLNRHAANWSLAQLYSEGFECDFAQGRWKKAPDTTRSAPFLGKPKNQVAWKQYCESLGTETKFDVALVKKENHGLIHAIVNSANGFVTSSSPFIELWVDGSDLQYPCQKHGPVVQLSDHFGRSNQQLYPGSFQKCKLVKWMQMSAFRLLGVQSFSDALGAFLATQKT